MADASDDRLACAPRANSMERLGIIPSLTRTCKSLRIVNPTEIQRKTIPLVLQRRNVIGIAQTGSGKTLCYCLPTLQLLSQDAYGVFALVLLPTKELAIQVFEQFQVLCAPLGCQRQICLIVGGDDWLTQSRLLAQRPYVVIATPGRLSKHLEATENREAFSELGLFVLDEADRLLSGTIKTEIKQIIEAFPNAPQQHILFTATLTDVVKSYFLHSPEDRTPSAFQDSAPLPYTLVDVTTQNPSLDTLQHFYIYVPSRVKPVYLVHLLMSTFAGQPGIIFTKTCQTAQILTTLLELFELPVTCLHGLLDHKRRVAHLAKFRSNAATLLVATDVASRGLDIPKVNFIISFDFPTATEDYVHRVGRTARIGRKGVALSIICEKDETSLVKVVENHINQELELLEVKEADALARLSDVTRKQQEASQILHEARFFEHATATRKLKLKKRKREEDHQARKLTSRS